MVEAVQRTLLPEGSGPDDGPEWSTILNGKLSIKALDGDHDQPAPEQGLREAAAKGDLATLDVLLASATSFDINSVNPKTGKTALHYALQAPNSMEVVKRLLNAGIDMTITDKTGKTAFDLTSGPFALHLMPARLLMVAAATGQLKKAVANLKEHLDQQGDKKDWTTLNKDWTKVNALLGMGADVQVLADAGISPHDVRYIANDDKALAALKAIIAKNPEKLWEDLDTGYTPYEAFSHFGKEITLTDGTKRAPIPRFEKFMNMAYEGAHKALQDAFKAGDWKRAVAIIRKHDKLGIDPKARYEHSGESNVSLLSYAAGEGKLDVVKALIEVTPKEDRAGFINKKGSRGRTALHSAGEGKHKEVYNYLKGQGGDDTIMSDATMTPAELLAGEEDVAPPPPPPHYGPPTADMKRPKADKRTAAQIIRDSPILANLGERERRWLKNGFDGDWGKAGKPENPFKGIGDYEKDADKAWLAVQILEHIERYEADGTAIKGDSVGDGRLTGFNSAVNGDARNGTEAGRFQDFTKYGFGTLKGGIQEGDSGGPGEGADLITRIKYGAYNQVIANAKLPADRADILKNPGNYSVEQKYAARLELYMTYERLMSNPEGWGHARPLRLAENSIRRAIKKLSSKEVDEYAAKNEPLALQKYLATQPTLRAEAEALYGDMKKGIGIEKFLEGDKVEGLKSFSELANTLNMALGKNGSSRDDVLTINLEKHDKFGEVKKIIKDEFANENALKDLVAELGEEKGILEFAQRAAVFGTFGLQNIPEIIQLNQQNYLLSDVALDDFNGSGLIENGKLNEKAVEKLLKEMYATDPDHPIFKEDDGTKIGPTQIMVALRAAWDAFRNDAKIKTAQTKLDLGAFLKREFYTNKKFSSGAMHGVSSILAVGIAVARSEGSGELSFDEKMAAAGNGIQAFGLGVQAAEFVSRGAFNFYRTNIGPTSARLEKFATNAMNFGKTFNGVGGMLSGAFSIAIAADLIRKGDPGGALIMTMGVSNLVSSMGPLIEAMARPIANLANAAFSVSRNAALFIGIGHVARALNVVAILALIAYGFYEAFKNRDAEVEYDKRWMPKMEEYGLWTRFSSKNLPPILRPDKTVPDLVPW